MMKTRNIHFYRYIYHRIYGKSFQFIKNTFKVPSLPKISRSNIDVDVIIPVGPNETEMFGLVVQSVRRFLCHPINKIYVVAPTSSNLEEKARDIDCTYIDENNLIPNPLRDIDIRIDGVDRSGWLRQQIIKLNASSICSRENYIFVDADTVLVNDMVFIRNGKYVFYTSDEYYYKYYLGYKKLLGLKGRHHASFISHMMIFNKGLLEVMKKEIESYSRKRWFEAISELCSLNMNISFAEQETYGNFVLNNYTDRVQTMYWHNLHLRRDELSNLDVIVDKYGKNYRSLSFHHYLG